MTNGLPNKKVNETIAVPGRLMALTKCFGAKKTMAHLKLFSIIKNLKKYKWIFYAVFPGEKNT